MWGIRRYRAAMSTNFLAPGVGLLVLSLLTRVLAPESGSFRTIAFVGWLASATFWLAMLCVAAHLLQEVLRENRT